MLGLGRVWFRDRFIVFVVGGLKVVTAWNSNNNRFLNKSGSPWWGWDQMSLARRHCSCVEAIVGVMRSPLCDLSGYQSLLQSRLLISVVLLAYSDLFS